MTTPPSAPPAGAARSEMRTGRAAAVGLIVAVAVVAAAFLVPPLVGWDTVTRRDDKTQIPPLHGFPWVHWGGWWSVAAIVLAVVGVAVGPRLAERLRWPWLMVWSYVVGAAWLFALALVDGQAGLTRVLGNKYEYLITAREIADIPAMLAQFIDRIGYDAADNWPTHVAGHPPGALLFFVVLVRLGLGGDLASAVVVTLLAATIPLAVQVTGLRLGAEAAVRRATPFLVLTPAAVFLAVSADAMFAAVAAWGLAALAVAATSPRAGRRLLWSVVAGLLLGYCVLLSYGLALLGPLALAVLFVARSWRPLVPTALAALGVVLAFAAAGFVWWEALPVLHERYYEGVASERPTSYWIWGNLGALVVSAGPAVGAGLGAALAVAVRARRGTDATDSPDSPAARPAAAWLALGALAGIALADASMMSKSEVERIWLPWIPWLTLSLALLPPRWLRPLLALQLAAALVVQHLLYTSW